MIVSSTTCKELNDKEIIQRSLDQVDFFSCLYQRYSVQMMYYIKRITNVSKEASEDILQDAFINVWKHLHEYDDSLKFSSWLYRIVHNTAVSYWRKQERIHTTKEHIKNTVRNEEEENVDESELVNVELRKAIDQLPDKYREVMILKFLEGQDYEDISDILMIPEGTVATRINRAKKALRKIIDNSQYFA